MYRLMQYVLIFKKSSGSNTCYKKYKGYITAFLNIELDLNAMKKRLCIFIGLFEKLTKSDYYEGKSLNDRNFILK